MVVATEMEWSLEPAPAVAVVAASMTAGGHFEVVVLEAALEGCDAWRRSPRR